jgi:cleavage and polyadenylation specificity factor subunit 1
MNMQHADGREKQTVKDTDGNMTRPKIRSAFIMDPYVLIVREDDTLGLFVGEPSRGKIRRKDMSAFGDKVRVRLYTPLFSFADALVQRLRYSSATFFEDTLGRFRIVEVGSNTNVGDSSIPSQWIVLCRMSGIIEVTQSNFCLGEITEQS